jgi:hypothetical protein
MIYDCEVTHRFWDNLAQSQPRSVFGIRGISLIIHPPWSFVFTESISGSDSARGSSFQTAIAIWTYSSRPTQTSQYSPGSITETQSCA